MKITYDKGLIVLSFPYNPVMVKFIKENFADRKYDPSNKTWNFPPYRKNIEILRKNSDLFSGIPDDIDILPSFIITEEEKIIIIRSRYDTYVVDLIKSIPPSRRLWKKDENIWIIHKTHFNLIANELINYLDKSDDLYICTIDIDEYVTYDEKKRLEKKIEKKSSPDEHKKLLDDLKKKFPFLRDYQVSDVVTMVEQENIFDCNEPGLGKTIETGAFIKKNLDEHKRYNVLIIAPKAILNQWKEELFNFFEITSNIISDNIKKRLELYKIFYDVLDKKKDIQSILIVNYAKLLSSDFSEFLLTQTFDLLVLDEVTKIKDGRTKVHKAVKEIKANKIIALTGTPVENRIQELYSLMNVIDYRFFGKFSDFAYNYLIKNEWGGLVAKYDAPRKLGSKMNEFNGFIRWKKEEVLKELPEVITNRYEVVLSKNERKMYEQLLDGDLIIKNEEGKVIDLDNDLALLQVLRRAVSDLSIYFSFKESSKKKLFYELISDYLDVDKNRKIVCFSQYSSIVLNYALYLNSMGINPVVMTGETKDDDREFLLKEFKESKDNNILICTDIFSYGVNIQEASYLINIDLPWNPAVLKQRIGRLHRIGQKNPVNVINLVTKDTIEENVFNIILKKVKMFDEIISVNEKSVVDLIKKEIHKRREEVKKVERSKGEV